MPNNDANTTANGILKTIRWFNIICAIGGGFGLFLLCVSFIRLIGIHSSNPLDGLTEILFLTLWVIFFVVPVIIWGGVIYTSHTKKISEIKKSNSDEVLMKKIKKGRIT